MLFCWHHFSLTGCRPLPSGYLSHTSHPPPPHPLASHQIHTTCNYYKFSFFRSTVGYWNQLPASIVLLPTLNQFNEAVHMTTAYCKTTQQFSLYLFLSLLCMLFNPMIYSFSVLASLVIR